MAAVFPTFHRTYLRARDLVRREIWRTATLDDHSWRGEGYRILRIVFMTVQGLVQKNLPSRAGALSFGTLVALAPLLAITIAVSGFMLGGNDEVAIVWLNRLLSFIAPHLQYMEPGTGEAALNPRLVEMLNSIIASSRSGALGAVGFLMLVVMVINLFTSVETTFNEIWGVARGRTWMSRIAIYWTVLTLGTLLAFAALSLVSVGAIASLFQAFNLESEARAFLGWSTPLLAFLLLVAALALFYRFVPNASVGWRPAVIGGAVVAIMLILNHFFAFVYVNRVVMEKSFYGQLGIVFVLMAGLYIFWFFVLVGGVISYAVQNADYLCRDPDWSNLSHRAREMSTLLVYLRICRRYAACVAPPSVRELSDSLHLPAVVIHQCLQRLKDMGLVNYVDAGNGSEPYAFRAEPARPLDKVTLGQFREAFETLGTGDTGDSLRHVDPAMVAFYEEMEASLRRGAGARTLADLTADRPAQVAETAR